MVKNPPASVGDMRDTCSIPGLGRSPGGGHGNQLQYSCLENPPGQRSLADCSPWGCKELDSTERLSTAQHSTGCCLNRLIISTDSLPLCGAFPEHLPFKGEVATLSTPQAQTRTVLINKVNRRRGLICSSHTKLRMWQVMVSNINTSEVRRTTYNRNCLACKDLFPM